jgi:hypothetical protein
VDSYDPSDKQSLVHLYFVLGGHAYHISIALPPGEGRKPVPGAVWAMLNGLLEGVK